VDLLADDLVRPVLGGARERCRGGRRQPGGRRAGDDERRSEDDEEPQGSDS
jgi:hypothetical protein